MRKGEKGETCESFGKNWFGKIEERERERENERGSGEELLSISGLKKIKRERGRDRTR